jgi:hypothetical protein
VNHDPLSPGSHRSKRPRATAPAIRPKLAEIATDELANAKSARKV